MSNLTAPLASQIIIAAIADDMTLVCPRDITPMVLGRFIRCLIDVGVVVSSKSAIFSMQHLSDDEAYNIYSVMAPLAPTNLAPNANILSRQVFQEQRVHSRAAGHAEYVTNYATFPHNGMLLLQTPIGSVEYKSQWVNKKIDDLILFMERLVALQNPQLTSIMLQYCSSTQLYYYLRVVPVLIWSRTDAIQRFKRSMHSAFLRAMYWDSPQPPVFFENPDLRLQYQLSLPMSDNGWNLPMLDILHPYIFTSGTLSAVKTIMDAYPLGHPVRGLIDVFECNSIDACILAQNASNTMQTQWRAVASHSDGRLNAVFNTCTALWPTLYNSTTKHSDTPRDVHTDFFRPKYFLHRDKNQRYFSSFVKTDIKNKLNQHTSTHQERINMEAKGIAGASFKKEIIKKIPKEIFAALARHNLGDPNPLNIPTNVMCVNCNRDMLNMEHAMMCKNGPGGVIRIHDKARDTHDCAFP
jgi:hypothetical protein